MRRKIANNSHYEDDTEESSGLVSISMTNRNVLSPSAEELMTEAAKFGYCQKRNNSFLAYILPCFFPRWKKRFFILVGNYLFRYSSEQGISPKGVPIPLDSVTCRLVPPTEEENCFEVAMIRKVYIIKAASEEECRSWIKAINDRKGAAIRENLGHAPANSNVKAFNRAGAALFDSTLRKDATSTVNPMQSQ
jgi:PH domain